MNTYLNKIAAILALAIGAMATFAGGKVLLGSDPGYYVINWLPVYNYTAGILTVLVTTTLIWLNHKLAWPAAIISFGLHALIMIILQTSYKGVVAPDSIQAMTVRMITWVVILGLMYAQQRRKVGGK